MTTAAIDWGQLFELIGKRTAEAQKAILDTDIKVREVDRQIKDLEGKLASLAPGQVSRTEVKVALAAEDALEAAAHAFRQIGQGLAALHAALRAWRNPAAILAS